MHFALVFMAIALTTACESDFKKIQQFNKVSFFPIGEAENIQLQYIDSGRVKAILTGKKMVDFSNVSNPFTEFPNGLHIILYDNNNNKNTVEADYGVQYAKSELINLIGNVVITTFDGKKLEADQLYYDQKNEWLYTEGKYKASTDKENFTQGIGVDFNSKLTVIKAKNSYAETIKKEE